MKGKEKKRKGFRLGYDRATQLQLHTLMLPGTVLMLLFSIVPLFGLLLAFKNYSVIEGIKGVFTSPWYGFQNFKVIFGNFDFKRMLVNTLGINLIGNLVNIVMAILFALFINEIAHPKFKSFVQTVTYMPHFISWVIISSISYQFLSQSGIINTLLKNMHVIDKPIKFLTDASKFWGLAVSLDIWKEMGWWTIIFLAAIVGISQDYYEAAQIDGATRLQRIFYITLPCIKSTIVVVLIMTMGNLFGGGLSGSNFEQCYLLGNNVNADTSTIIQTYVFDVGLAQGRYAYATAVGLIQSVISLVLIFASNFVSKKLAGSGLF